MTAISLRARWVLPIDGPPIEGGFVTIAAGRIASVVHSSAGTEQVEDLGDVVLMPGLVNAHTHLEFSDRTTPLGERGMSLPAWIPLVIAERKRAHHDAAAAIVAGLAESLAAGVTTLGEISAAAPAGLNVQGARPAVLAFQESIGFSAQRVDSALADVLNRFDLAPTPAGFSPHAPYTVHPRLLERIVETAIACTAPVAMHLAESREELQLLANGDGPFRELLESRSMWDPGAIPPGSRPLDYLHRLANAPRALVIHGNYLAAGEIDYLGRQRSTMSAVYCPRTHAWFGHEPYPLLAMQKAGVRVVLGTDSRASNPDLSLLAELRFAAGQFPQVAPATLLQMATRDAAESLGLGSAVGTLAPGKRADLIAIRCDLSTADPYAGVALGDASVERVWIFGQPWRPSPMHG